MSKVLDEKDLLALGALFQDAQTIADPDSASFEPLPDGEYICSVVSVEITKTKGKEENGVIVGGGKLMAAWRFKVAEGEEGANRNIFKNSVLTDNAKNVKRLLTDVAKFGIEVASVAELLGRLEELKDELCVVTLKTDDQNRQWITVSVPQD